MHKHLLAMAATMASIAGAAAPASAAPLYGSGKDIAYAVRVDGQGTYKYHENRGTAEDPIFDDVDVTFDYRDEFYGVVFRNGSPVDTKADDLPIGHAKGSYSETGIGTCPVESNEQPAHGWARFVDQHGDDLLVPLDGQVHLWLRPLDRFDLMFACPGADASHGSHPVAGLVAPWGDDPFDAKGNVIFGHNQLDIDWALPRDIIGMGKIIQLIPQHAYDGDKCPGWINDQTISCHIDWSAKILMKKVWEKPFKEGDPVPSGDDDLLVPLVPQKKASLSKDGSKAKLSVSCWAGCSGTASVVAGARGGAKARSASVPKALTHTSFKVAIGATKDITITLGASARRAVQRAGGARIVVETTSAGQHALTTLPLRLGARGAGR